METKKGHKKGHSDDHFCDLFYDLFSMFINDCPHSPPPSLLIPVYTPPV